MDVIDLLRRANSSTAAVVERVPENLLDAPTPCARWTIRDIVEHMAGNSHHMLERIDRKSTADDFAALNTIVLDAYDDPEVQARKFELAGIELSGRDAVAVNFADVLVHGWDIARAAGLDVSLDDDLCTAAFRVTSRFPENLRGPDGAFDHARPIPDDAPVQQRLLAYLGRDPEWSATQRQAS
jgi:uncharacterized protein (TIGR03086 family)